RLGIRTERQLLTRFLTDESTNLSANRPARANRAHPMACRQEPCRNPRWPVPCPPLKATLTKTIVVRTTFCHDSGPYGPEIGLFSDEVVLNCVPLGTGAPKDAWKSLRMLCG